MNAGNIGMLGSIVGHYSITAELGHGGMGEVWQAQDTRLGRPVALKFLSERNARDRSAVDRFLREARAASALNHPNIVTIYDIGETERGRFIAMELIQGRTLRSLAADGTAMTRLLEIGGQVAKALAAAHAAGIVHRDIKPENIMVRDDGYVKVLDFGLARLAPAGLSSADAETEAVTDPGTLLGTVRYMSPEQGRAETVTAASDIFSLGLIFYELATGRHPFQSDSQIGVLHAILSQSPVAPSRVKAQIPVALDSLILRMIEKDPRLRPSAAEVDAALAEMAGRAPAGQPAPAAIPAKRLTVGRKKQIAELRAAFDSAAAGRGLLVCVAGEPGIGKTTLVEDFLLELAVQGLPCSVARGRCSERLAGSEAYLPVLEVLEGLLHGDLGGSAAHNMKRVAPSWYVQIAPLSTDDSSFTRVMAEAKAASQERVKREMAAFLQEITRARTLVLFFDDLHWADLSTVDLLSFLGGKLGSMGLLLVGTYRPSDLLLAKHPFLQLKLELQGHGACREIALDFLSREDIETYLALEFPENRFPPDLPTLIHGKTEGNPLFMANLVRDLRDHRAIAEEQGRWTLVQSLAEVERGLPESVRSMIERKIDRLGDADRRLLVAASVEGHEFDSAVVAKALAIEAAEVEERLEALDRVHAFVRLAGEREFPDGTLSLRYSFVHVLYQNALYATLTATRKASLSASVAAALLEHYGEQDAEVALELALLFEAARDFAKASDYFRVAAKNAAALYANQEAIALCGRAIAKAEKLKGDTRHSRVHLAAMQLALLHERGSRFGDAADTFAIAEKAAAETKDIEAQIEAICGRANALFIAKRMEETRADIKRASELARQHGSRKALASVEIIHSSERLCAGDFDAAMERYDQALAVLREQGLSRASLLGVNFRGSLYAWRLESQEALHLLEWGYEKAQEIGDLVRILQTFFMRAIALGHDGRLGPALTMLDAGRRLAEANHERFVLARLPNTQGWLYRELLDFERALLLDLEGVRLSTEVGDAEAAINAHINAGQVYILLGEPERAFEQLKQAEDLLNRFNWFTWVFNTRLQAELATYWIARGDLKKAASHASQSLEISKRSLARKHMAWAHKLLADIAALEDRVEDAGREFENGLRIFEKYPCPTVEWRILRARAAFERQLGDSAAADATLGRARAVLKSLAESVPQADLREKMLSSKEAHEL